MSTIQVAIDGPAASGKSSAARLLAHELGYLYLDSGAVYRSVTLAGLRGLDFGAEELERNLDELALKLTPHPDRAGCSVYMCSEDVSDIIRDPGVAAAVAPVAADPRVRKWVTAFLRNLAAAADVVMDGRDIGSVVLPHAAFKFFITASLEVRARRHLSDLEAVGKNSTLKDAMESLARRDHSDLTRIDGPLVEAADAILIDNSNLSLEETLKDMSQRIRAHC
ncbi:MAG: (d)CMP kinase [Planctomycetes bacterium]|nr:(d)CMP kinase [Planctomycetota bacterium]